MFWLKPNEQYPFDRWLKPPAIHRDNQTLAIVQSVIVFYFGPISSIKVPSGSCTSTN